MNIPILYEDEDLVVIDKSPGIIVNRSENAKDETIQDWAEEKLKIKNRKLKIGDEDFYNRAGIVHRLDKDTSGLLLIAKNPNAFKNLQSQFFNRLVSKRYITLVHDEVNSATGEIKVPVGRLPWDRRKFGILTSGREASTSFKVISYYSYISHKQKNIYTLLEIIPQTGRTHQIRIHLKYLGHPVVADKLYAGRKTYKKDLKFCPRLFLHAGYLKFQHPERGEWMEIRSELPKDLQGVLENLKSSNEILLTWPN